MSRDPRLEAAGLQSKRSVTHPYAHEQPWNLPSGSHWRLQSKRSVTPDSPRGSNKARAFAAALGITAADAPKLREKLLEIARVGEVQLGELDMYGQRYMIEFEMETEAGKAVVRSG
jgi:hypothetical protein